MKRFKFNQKSILVISSLFTIALLIGGVSLLKSASDGYLSAKQLDEKFDCNRITADFRYTDVFCGNPKFYNDPDGITYDEYYEYQGCKERLQNQPPAESLRETDPGFYDAYYDCKDPSKLEQLRQDFIENLKKLKEENG